MRVLAGDSVALWLMAINALTSFCNGTILVLLVSRCAPARRTAWPLQSAFRVLMPAPWL